MILHNNKDVKNQKGGQGYVCGESLCTNPAFDNTISTTTNNNKNDNNNHHSTRDSFRKKKISTLCTVRRTTLCGVLGL